MFFEDEKPALLKQIDEAFEKVSRKLTHCNIYILTNFEIEHTHKETYGEKTGKKLNKKQYILNSSLT